MTSTLFSLFAALFVAFLAQSYFESTGRAEASFCVAPAPAAYVLAQKSRRSVARNNAESNDDASESSSSPRDALGRELRGLRSTGLKNLGRLEAGDTVVSKREIPNLGIHENKGYELVSVYAQTFRESTQSVERLPLRNLESEVPKGYDRYVTLYNPVYHEEPVVVTPEEVGIVSVRDELVSSAWLAVPGFFWVFVAFSFYNTYHERTGGSFFDAFWGR